MPLYLGGEGDWEGGTPSDRGGGGLSNWGEIADSWHGRGAIYDWWWKGCTRRKRTKENGTSVFLKNESPGKISLKGRTKVSSLSGCAQCRSPTG